jgi:GyrI-like small molecule binding domain
LIDHAAVLTPREYTKALGGHDLPKSSEWTARSRSMGIDVGVEVLEPRRLAAVRRLVPDGAVASAWRPALDLVWSFLGSQPGLRTDGHNIFLYHHPARRGDPMPVDFGVEVTRSFSPSGEVHETATPRGEAAVAVHRGGYDRLHAAHHAIQQWAKSHDRSFAGTSWEIYGDWSDDPSKLETIVAYLLA